MRTAGVFLVTGLAFGLAAAWVPSLGPVWNARPPEQLVLIADRRQAWIVASLLFALGLIAALFGVLALCGNLLDGTAAPWAWVAIGSFVVGTTLWLVHLGYRMTVMVMVADETAAGMPMPDWLLPSWHLGNYLLVAYVALASIGLVGIGIALLETALLPTWSAWTVIALAALFLTTLAVLRNTMPVLPHLATGLLGVLAVVNHPAGT